MRNEKAIQSILASMRVYLQEAKRARKKGYRDMIAVALRSARQCKEQLQEYMSSEEARQLYIKLYDEIVEVKKDK